MIGARELVAAAAALAMTPAPVVATPREPPTVDLRAGLFDRQQQAWDCEGTRCLLTSRRAGKSTLLAPLLLMIADAHPGGVASYIAPTQKHARRILWRILVSTARAAWGDQIRVYETTMTIVTPRGGMVRLGGCDDKAAVAAHVGEPIVAAAVDECGKFPSDLLQELVEDALEPATVDYQGPIILAGVPGILRAGYWHSLTGPGRTTTYPVFHWTLFDNPHIPHAREFVAELMRKRGWTEQTPTYRREYLGEWCDDEGALVFPIDLERNVVRREPRAECPCGLPPRSRSGVVLPVTQWRFTIAFDVGIVDATAIGVLAVHPLDPREFVVSTEKHRAMLPRQLGVRVRALRQLYPNAPVVGDTGGMGKVHAEELTRVFAMHVEPAEKRERESNVRQMRDELLGGRLCILDGPENDALIEECAVLGWDDGRRFPDPDGEDHAVDTVLYGRRRLRHYRDAEAIAAPVEGTPEWYAAEDARIERLLEERARNGAQGGWYR